MKVVQCPECKGKMEVAQHRENIFCDYCGAYFSAAADSPVPAGKETASSIPPEQKPQADESISEEPKESSAQPEYSSPEPPAKEQAADGAGKKAAKEKPVEKPAPETGEKAVEQLFLERQAEIEKLLKEENYLKAGQLELENEQFATALIHFEKALETETGNPEAWYGKGCAAGCCSTVSEIRTGEMIKSFRKAVSLADSAEAAKLKDRAVPDTIACVHSLALQLRSEMSSRPSVKTYDLYLENIFTLIGALEELHKWLPGSQTARKELIKLCKRIRNESYTLQRKDGTQKTLAPPPDISQILQDKIALFEGHAVTRQSDVTDRSQAGGKAAAFFPFLVALLVAAFVVDYAAPELIPAPTLYGAVAASVILYLVIYLLGVKRGYSRKS